MVSSKESSIDRVQAFSDGVFAVLITILVLELHAPSEARWSVLLEFWPEAIGYAASYLFIAIVWLNHHHLLRFSRSATPRLMWVNFVHLFTVSWLPFATSWLAKTRMSGVAVCAYAVTFALVNASYIALSHEAIDRLEVPALSKGARRLMRIRSVLTLVGFVSGGLVGLWHPIVGFALVCACLTTYLRPEIGS